MLLGTVTQPRTEGGVADVAKVDPATPSDAQPSGRPSGWVLTMSEEFNGAIEYAHAASGHIRMRPDGPLWRGWYPDYFHGPLNQSPRTHPSCVYVCTLDNLRVENSTARLIGERLPEIRKDSLWPKSSFTSGSLSSHPGHNQTFGYFEARMRCPGERYWPAFWMLPETVVADAPQEIDIFEGFNSPSVASTRLHPTASSTASTDNNLGTLKGWHTFGLERTPTTLRWYYDGVQVAYETNAANVPQVPMYVIFSLQIQDPTHYIDPTQPMPDQPASVDIDYIRCWEPA